MRYAQLLLVAIVLSLSLVFVQGRSAHAAFHCIRIHAVMAGYNGDSSIQYVELRMSAPAQSFIIGVPVRFYDAGGTLKATFTFPIGVPNTALGDSILIATQEFNDATLGGNANFTFTNGNTAGSNGGDPLHPVQSPDGKVTFAEGPTTCVLGGPNVVGSVAYGAFTGTVDYGSAATALPNPGDNRALRLGNLNAEASNNSTEYSLNAVSTTTFSVASGSLPTDLTSPRNNSRTVLQLQTGSPTATPEPTPTATPVTPTPTATAPPTPTPEPGASFGAKLTGAQVERPTGPTGSAGTGSGAVVLSTAEDSALVTIDWSGLGSAAISWHIHCPAPRKVGAPIVFDPVSAVPGTDLKWMLSAQDAANLKGRLCYFNVHSVGFPSGEIRGQIVPQSIGGIAELPEVAGTPLDATGTSSGNAGLFAGLIAAAVAGAVALGGAAWNVRRRPQR